MPFREPSAPAPVRRVVHGPFPVRGWRLLFAFGMIVPVASFMLMGARSSTFECKRERGREEICTFEEDGPLLPPIRRTFSSHEMVEVRVREVGGRRGASASWDLVITDARGAETVVASSDVGEELQRFIDRPDEISIATPASKVPYGIALIAVLAGLGVALHSLRGAGRIVIELDPSHDALRVVRKVLGMRRGRPLELRLGDVEDVRLERGPIADGLRPARQEPELGGRLVLVLRDGSAVPLSDRMMRGGALHRRALDALRDALALPALAAEPSSSGVPRAWKIPLIVSGIVVVAGIGGSILMSTLAASGDEGTLEIVASVRCRFQGMDLLPGGAMQTTLPAGDHPVQVWSPSAPGHWEERTAHVTKGRRTRFVCR